MFLSEYLIGGVQFGVLFWGFLFVCFLQNLIKSLKAMDTLQS